MGKDGDIFKRVGTTWTWNGERGTGTGNGDRELGQGTRMGYKWKGNDCSCDR